MVAGGYHPLPVASSPPAGFHISSCYIKVVCCVLYHYRVRYYTTLAPGFWLRVGQHLESDEALPARVTAYIFFSYPFPFRVYLFGVWMCSWYLYSSPLRSDSRAIEGSFSPHSPCHLSSLKKIYPSYRCKAICIWETTKQQKPKIMLIGWSRLRLSHYVCYGDGNLKKGATILFFIWIRTGPRVRCSETFWSYIVRFFRNFDAINGIKNPHYCTDPSRTYNFPIFLLCGQSEVKMRIRVLKDKEPVYKSHTTVKFHSHTTLKLKLFITAVFDKRLRIYLRDVHNV